MFVKRKYIRSIEERIHELELRLKDSERKNSELEARIENIGGLEKNVRNINEQLKWISLRFEDMGTLETNVRNINSFTEKTEDNMDALNIKLRKLDKSIQQEAKATIDLSPCMEEQVGSLVIQSDEHSYKSIDYFDFENHFRGNRAAIKEAQKQYLPYFMGKKNVLDLGCGRGEFLELLKENRISAVGVDFYEDFAEYCNERGLPAVCGDAVDYLSKYEGTIDGIFAGQLVEHLKPEQIQSICNLAYEKMEEGAYLVMETPNPTSLAIYTNAFYIDPSHVKPVHPLTLKYYMEKAGFKKVDIIFTENSKPDTNIPQLNLPEVEGIEEFNESMQRVSSILFGSQDFAAIAQK